MAESPTAADIVAALASRLDAENAAIAALVEAGWESDPQPILDLLLVAGLTPQDIVDDAAELVAAVKRLAVAHHG